MQWRCVEQANIVSWERLNRIVSLTRLTHSPDVFHGSGKEHPNAKPKMEAIPHPIITTRRPQPASNPCPSESKLCIRMDRDIFEAVIVAISKIWAAYWYWDVLDFELIWFSMGTYFQEQHKVIIRDNALFSPKAMIDSQLNETTLQKSKKLNG